MSASLERQIKVFCPTHRIGYETRAAKIILCEAGGHTLTQSFPDENFWEYCCDCQTFFPSGVAKESRLKDACPVCEAHTTRRYLCDTCKLISFESDEPARGKAFSVPAQAAAVGPSCPACLSMPRSRPVFHACPELDSDFTTPRATCPFCQEMIEAAPVFPLSVAEYLNQVKAKKIIARLNHFDKSLRAADDGEFVVVPRGATDDTALAVPRLARLDSKQDFYAHYKDFYACDDPGAGLIVMQYPAVVVKSDDEWHLKDVGLLKITGDATMHAPPLTGNFAPVTTVAGLATEATGASDHLIAPAILYCPECGREAKPHHKFCKKCGKQFNHPPPAAFMPAATQNLASGLPPLSLPTSSLPAAQSIGATGSLNGSLLSGALRTGSSPTGSLTLSSSVARVTGTPRIMWIIGSIFALILISVFASLISQRTGSDEGSSSSQIRSTEGRLEDAIARGNLISPTGASAYEIYQQLQREGGAAAATRFNERLLPMLTERPQQMLADIAVPGSGESSPAEWDEAHRMLTWASEIRNGDHALAARATYCAGRVAHLRERNQQALELWRRASALDSSWALPPNSIGNVLNNLEDYETARRYLREAIRLNPNWAIPHNNMGTSYLRQGDYDQAAGYYERARALAPDWARPYAWLGDIANERRDYCGARDLYQAAIDRATPGMSSWDPQRMQNKLNRATEQCAQIGGYGGY